MAVEGYTLPYSAEGLTSPFVYAATRTGQGYALGCWAQANGDLAILKVLNSVETTLILGFAFQYAPTSGHTNFLRFDYRAGGVSYAQMAVGVNNSGQVTVSRMSSNANPGIGAVIASSSNNTIFPGTWYFIEVKYNWSTGGLCEVRVDNTVVLSFSGNTQSSDTIVGSGVNTIQMGGQGSYSDTYFDDLYVLDDNMAGLHDYLGDHTVVTAYPVSDAGPNQWTGSATGSHYPLLADIENDGTNVYTATFSQQEAYGLSTFPSSVIGVTAAQVHVRAQRDSASGMTLEVQATGVSNTVSSSAFTLGTSYAGYDLIMEKNADGGDWSVATAQATLIGFESIT